MQDTMILSFYEAEFTEDFGSIKKGDKFSSICVDYGKGIIEGYTDEGDIIVTQKFIGSPVNE